MTTAPYGIEAIHEVQKWIVDQIQKVNTRNANDVARLSATTAGCDAIRSAGIPPTRPMLERRAARHFMKAASNKQNG
jgi:hypothetical protein